MWMWIEMEMGNNTRATIGDPRPDPTANDEPDGQDSKEHMHLPKHR